MSKSSVRKPLSAVRACRGLLPLLPVASLVLLLTGCGGADLPASTTSLTPSTPLATATPTIPTPTPATPTPIIPATPTPTPSSPAPAQIVTGALRIEDATGTVITAPFTPASASAKFPTGFSVVISPATFVFESSESAADSLGEVVIGRTLTVSLPADVKAGTVLKVGATNGVTAVRTEISYIEKRNRSNIVGFPVEYVQQNGDAAGTITVVSIVGDVYTLDFDAGLTGRFVSANGTFRLRGTVSLYAPKPAENTGGIPFPTIPTN